MGRKPAFGGFITRSNINLLVQPQGLAESLKFPIEPYFESSV